MREADNIFQVAGPKGVHQCIAMKPHSCDYYTLKQDLFGGKLPKDLAMVVVHQLLACVNWLHFDCGVIHSGASPSFMSRRRRH